MPVSILIPPPLRRNVGDAVADFEISRQTLDKRIADLGIDIWTRPPGV